MPLVMLRRDATGPFRRCIRDEKGTILETLEFAPGVPQNVPGEKVSAIFGDLYKALLPVAPQFVPGSDPPQLNGKFDVIPREEFDRANDPNRDEAESEVSNQMEVVVSETSHGTKPAKRPGK